jgi:hypothetical protein
MKKEFKVQSLRFKVVETTGFYEIKTLNSLFEFPDFDISVPDGVAMILEQDVAAFSLAEAFCVFEFAFSEVLFVIIAGTIEFEHFNSIEPVFDMIAADDDAYRVELADGFEDFVF